MNPGRSLGIAVLTAALFASALAAQGVEREADRSKLISLNSQVIDTTAPEGHIPAHLTARSAADGGEVLLVKFPRPATAEQIAALTRSGARIYTYLPYYTYLVKMPAAGHAKALRRATGASWTGPYHPFYKISRYVAAVAPGQDKAAGGFKSVMVDVFPDADLPKVVEQIRDLGVQGVAGAKKGSFFSRVRLLLSPAEIARFRDDLAQIPEVFWIDLEPRRELLNDTTIWVGQSGLSAGQTTPVFTHGIFGEGQTVGIIDTGIDADMCYFRDTTRGLPPTNLCNGGTVVDNAQRKVIAVDFLTASECSGGVTSTEWDTQNHGTHVAGTVAGDNFANLLTHDAADGMAPGAKLVFQDAGFLTDNCGDLPGIGCPVVDLKPIFLQAYTQGARLHTNSWGDNENGAVQNNYTAASQDVDQFMWDHKDFQIFFAAGNAGPGTGSVGSPSTAKSVVSVGATLRGTSANSMASFSSCGPTDDGRIKPDITVPGSNIVSAGNDGNITTNNCGTRTMSGTSMASPGATGLTALVRQYYTDGWYPSGAKTPANGFTPTAALLRATLVNSAQAMTGTGTTPIPGNCQGWGRVLLDNALFFNADARKLQMVDDTTGFATGSVNVDRTFTYTVNSNTQALKVTLAWTDFPSTPAANPHLNNDLDLIVTGPAGTFKGNVFSAGVSATGGTADRRNTLEQVLLATPAAGTYTVTVRAINVPTGPQPFALVVTGDVAVATGNQPPVANAGPDQNVNVNALVTLNGTGSSDPDHAPNPLTFAWTEISGPAVTLANPSTASPTFTPTVAGTYTFQLQVSDGAATSTDQVVITVSLPTVTVFFDNFETSLGWTTNPSGTDTATTGQWERGVPQTTNSGGVKQLATTISGTNDLVTGHLAGIAAGDFDVDSGTTSIQSPAITLPSTGNLTLSFSFYFAHGTNSSTADFFRVQVVGTTTTTVFQVLGSTANVDAAWAAQSASLNAFAGQTVRILISAADASTASLVEAAVDDVKIVQQ